MSARKAQRRKSSRGDVLLLCCSHTNNKEQVAIVLNDNATRFKLLFGKVIESMWPHCEGEVYCIRKLGHIVIPKEWKED